MKHNWPWLVAGYALSCVLFVIVAARISWRRNRRSNPGEYDGRDYEHRDSPHFEDYIWVIAAPMWPGVLAMCAILWPIALAFEELDNRRKRRWGDKHGGGRR